MEGGNQLKEKVVVYCFAWPLYTLASPISVMRKDTILAALQNMPDEIELDALLERLIFVAKVEEGIQQSERGETISHEQMKKRVAQWSK